MFIENNSNNIMWGGMQQSTTMPQFDTAMTFDEKMEHYKWVKMIGTGSKVFGLIAGLITLYFLFIKLDQSNKKRNFKHLFEKPNENDPNYTLLNQTQIIRNKELQSSHTSFLTFNMLSIIFICFGFTMTYFSSNSIKSIQLNKLQGVQ